MSKKVKTISDMGPKAARRSARQPGQRLRLEVLLETGGAVLSADPAGLVAAEGKVGPEYGMPALTLRTPARIRCATASERSSDPENTPPGETIGAVVRDAHGVVIVLERDHCSKAAFRPCLPGSGQKATGQE
jgi:hypothetical protein